MRTSEYNTVDPDNGNITFNGPLEEMKGNHKHMPSRTSAYLEGDERGHLNASALGGTNGRSNVVAQNTDVNKTGFMAMESGEHNVLQNGGEIQSEKIAIVDGKPGDRPNTFMVNDTITYADGKTETIHNSFNNEFYADQENWNNVSASMPDTYEAPNPGDTLRDSMTTEEYSELMDSTDKELTGIEADYEETGLESETVTADEEAGAEAEAEADMDLE